MMEQQLEFVYLFKPKRENFLASMTLVEEMMAMEKHSEYVRNLFAEEKIILAGACLDGACGIVIFKAASPEVARTIFENDPAVQAAVVHAELHPYQILMIQGRSLREA